MGQKIEDNILTITIIKQGSRVNYICGLSYAHISSLLGVLADNAGVCKLRAGEMQREARDMPAHIIHRFGCFHLVNLSQKNIERISAMIINSLHTKCDFLLDEVLEAIDCAMERSIQ